MTELAAYASRSEESRGRRHAEPAPTNRSEFQRDRDRIVHAGAFRRLEYKHRSLSITKEICSARA